MDVDGESAATPERPPDASSENGKKHTKEAKPKKGAIDGNPNPPVQAVMAGARSAVVANKVLRQGLSREMRGILKHLWMLAWTII